MIKDIIDDPNGDYNQIYSLLHDLLLDEFKSYIKKSTLKPDDIMKLLKWENLISQCIIDINTESAIDISPFENKVLSVIRNREIEDIENRIKMGNEEY